LTALPSDQTLVVERFRDELGDWRICLLSPLGGRVHAPWALALKATLSARFGQAPAILSGDDGLVLRLAAGEAPPPAALFFPRAEEVEALVLAELGASALFAGRFRECAARALLLPRRRGGARAPLWAQRLRAQALLGQVRRHPDFPIVLETYRECINDVFDLPSLIEILRDVERGAVRVVEIETPRASPFARALAYEYQATYLYQRDAPAAERRAQALTLDRELLDGLLRADERAALIDPEIREELAAELSGEAEGTRAPHADGLHDLLRRVGELALDEVRARIDEPSEAEAWLASLVATGRAMEYTIAGERRFIAAGDEAHYHAALEDRDEAALDRLIARYARSRVSLSAGDLAARLGLVAADLARALDRLVAAGTLVVDGAYCDAEIARRLKRRALERLRAQIAPVDAPAFARFLARWQGLDRPAAGSATLTRAIDQLEGVALPLDELERRILPSRVSDYQPRHLDQLTASGAVTWIAQPDHRVELHRRERLGELAAPSAAGLDPLEQQILETLARRGASFYIELRALLGAPSDAALWRALETLSYRGLITNDSLSPLRAIERRRAARRPSRRPRAGRGGDPASLGQAGGRWSNLPYGAPGAAATLDTSARYALCERLLERYGVVSRETAAFEQVPGGFAALAPILAAMEDAGRVRRGHFVSGLRGAQYAAPQAVDLLRAQPEGVGALVLSAIDPCNPYGALVPWPDVEETPRRVPGAEVVLLAGAPVLYVEAGGRGLRLLAGPEALARVLPALRRAAERRQHRQLRIEQIDGEPALRSAKAKLLEGGGFRVEPNALVLDPIAGGP
jgi:ATP-dependent Lhr-like helicase